MADVPRCSVCSVLISEKKVKRFNGTCGERACILRAAERARIRRMGREGK
jgi:hypothetical protein